VKINPSILSADFSRLADELNAISSADAAHIDVMDNHFVPNLTIGLPVVKRLQQVSPIPLDVHLMIENVDSEAPKFAEVGVDSITFHIEASAAPAELIQSLRTSGVKVGIALKPGTPLTSASEFLDEIDMLLIMTVEPGFGGQSLLEQTLEKVSQARSQLDHRQSSVVLQVDGGINLANIRKLSELGADCAVAGAAVFGSGIPSDNISALRSAASHS
jgi:ribulose-phosphate 3-epimerase